jgi:mannose-1-phosphate guanylyltransferase
MQAVILVGGKGTRLRPLTYAEPKQMLPILGEPMLESVMQNLARHGVTKAVLSLGYLPDRFQAAYPNGVVAGIPVTYAVEPEPLDTAGAIRFAALAAGIDDTFVVVNGDVLTDLDLTRLVSFHTSKGAKATLALHPVDDPSRFGVVPTDEEGRVVAFIEKPPRDEAPTNEINAGTYVLEPSVIDTIEADVPVSVERVTFPPWPPTGSSTPWPTPATGSTPALPRPTSRRTLTCSAAVGPCPALSSLTARGSPRPHRSAPTSRCAAPRLGPAASLATVPSSKSRSSWTTSPSEPAP